MNEKKEFLTEENYERGKRKRKLAAIIVLLIGFSVGGFIVSRGILKQKEVDANYSEETINKLKNDIAVEKVNLETKKAELEGKGVKYDYSTKYDDGESYNLKVITNVLDPSFNHCSFDEYKNNAYTSHYCSLVNELEYKTEGINKSIDSSSSIPFYMFGGFIIIASCIVAIPIYMSSKGRELLVYHAQEVMPVAQEGIEKMAPTIGKAGASIAKEMAPVYGNIAKEISKGIKDGLKDNDEK